MAANLSEFVHKNKLFESGHYLTSNGLPIRDWINLDKLFTFSEFRDQIMLRIGEEIKNEDCVLVGVEYFGGIIASLVGYSFKKPFTYYFSEKKKNSVDESERKIFSIKSGTVYFIQDVAIHGDTLSKAIKETLDSGLIEKSVKIKAFVIFERKAGNRELPVLLTSPLVEEIICLNETFDVEICEKDKTTCLIRNNENNERCC